jgi:TolB-like protein
LFVAGVAALTIPLVGAAPATQASQVVVYPLVASQGAPPTIGLTVARFLVTGISQRGGIAAKLAPANTQQADYLATARTLGADYYVAGFVSAIGDEVSAVEQLVATKNGVIVWQNTAAYTVPDDARASGIAMHDAIVALTTPQYAPIPAGAADAPDSAPAPTVPTVSRRSAPSAPQSPLPIPAEAYAQPADQTLDGPRVVVLNFGGHALDAVRHYVPSSIIRTLPRYHMSGSVLDLGVSDVAADGLVACAQAGADYLIGGNIESGEEGDPGMGFSIATDLTLDIFDCKHMNAKPLVIEKSTANGDSQTSVDIAVDQALKAFAGMKPAAR